MSEKIVQTAGRDQLGDFAPMFAHLNDDVLFGEVWNEEAISVKTKKRFIAVSSCGTSCRLSGKNLYNQLSTSAARRQAPRVS